MNLSIRAVSLRRCFNLPKCFSQGFPPAGMDNPTPEEQEAFKAPIRQRYEDEGNPYFATARLWDDGIIDPIQTRDVLGLALAVTLNAPIPQYPRFGVFRM